LIKLEKLKLMRLEVAKKEAELEVLSDDTVTRAEAETAARQKAEATVQILVDVLGDVASAIAAKYPAIDRRLLLHAMLETESGYKSRWRAWYARQWPEKAVAAAERADGPGYRWPEQAEVAVKAIDNP